MEKLLLFAWVVFVLFFLYTILTTIKERKFSKEKVKGIFSSGRQEKNISRITNNKGEYFEDKYKLTFSYNYNGQEYLEETTDSLTLEQANDFFVEGKEFDIFIDKQNPLKIYCLEKTKFTSNEIAGFIFFLIILIFPIFI